MPVSHEFRQFVLDQLSEVMPVTARAMFGGVGLYAKGLFFALIDDDVVYFKADDQTRGDFLALGSKPFMPPGDKPSLSYYELPTDVLEDLEQLGEWMNKALGAARRKKK